MLFNFSQQDLRYGNKQVLSQLQLQIKRGEHVAIIGESGAGKSTLLKALRIQQPNIAWCPQQPGLVPMLNGLHNIYMGRLHEHHFLYNLRQLIYPSQHVRENIHSLSQQLGLDQQLYQACEQLSGGQQQRISIARALYSQQPIFIGDEPVSALDEYQGEEILQLLCRQFSTLIVGLHDVELALKCCQRIIALKDGKVLFDLSSKQLTSSDLSQVYQ